MIGKDFAQHLFSLRDRVAFVTGAGSGIGQTIACSLASAGARVVCFDLRDDGGLAETVSHIESIGGQACSYNGDVRQIADLRAAVALAKSRYGRLDIAVNAAGIANANPATGDGERAMAAGDRYQSHWRMELLQSGSGTDAGVRRRVDYQYRLDVGDYC